MQVCFVYITAANSTEAVHIGEALVKKKLAACVNIIPNIHSIYEWQGEIQKDQECILIAKSQKKIFAQLKAEVLTLHSYSCPCIVLLPLEDGHTDFLEWVVKQSSPI